MRPIRWLRRPSSTRMMTNAADIVSTFTLITGAQVWITGGVVWGVFVWLVGSLIARRVDRWASRPPRRLP